MLKNPIARQIQHDLLAACQAGRFLCLYPHVHADGDALGSCCALALVLRKLGAEGVAVLTEERVPGKLYQLLPPSGRSLFCSDPERISKKALQATFALTLDCSPGLRLGARAEYFAQTPEHWALDHHLPDDQQAEEHLIWRDTTAPATCELVGSLILSWEEELQQKLLERDEAQALLLGLLTDTGRFAYPATRPETLRLAARCVEEGADLPHMSYELFEKKTQAQFQLQAYVGQNTHWLLNQKAGICIITGDFLRSLHFQTTDFEGLPTLIRDVQGVEVALLLREIQQGHYKGSIRSQDTFDSQAFAAHFGGGGHARASGFVLEAADAEAAFHQVAQALIQFWEKMNCTEKGKRK